MGFQYQDKYCWKIYFPYQETLSTQLRSLQALQHKESEGQLLNLPKHGVLHQGPQLQADEGGEEHD